MACARIIARQNRLRQQVTDLDRETREEMAAACRTGDGPDRLPAALYDDFIRGQAWRKQRLLKEIDAVQKELNAARARWHAARVRLRQSEKMAEKDTLRLHQERQVRERKEMDMVGVLQRQSRSHQEEIL